MPPLPPQLPSHPVPVAVPTPQTPAPDPAQGPALGLAPVLPPAPALSHHQGLQTPVAEEGAVAATGHGSPPSRGRQASGRASQRSSSGRGRLRQRSRGVQLQAPATFPTALFLLFPAVH